MDNLDMSLGEDFKGSTDLAKHLAMCLGGTVLAKFIAHGYHWNVKGKHFSQLHEFFQEIYEDYDSAIDPFAENIRKLGYDAPYLLSDFIEISSIPEPTRITSGAHEMIASLYEINGALLGCIKNGFDVANTCNEQGIANFLAERIDMHQKWAWQLRSSLSLDVAPVLTMSEDMPLDEMDVTGF
jgi:starvation-inducible DNA-binding protein